MCIIFAPLSIRKIIGGELLYLLLGEKVKMSPLVAAAVVAGLEPEGGSLLKQSLANRVLERVNVTRHKPENVQSSCFALDLLQE